MATPSESITTVNGRRCTRSRARTAVTTSTTTEEPSIVTPTEATTSTTVEAAPQIQTSTAAAPPPPLPSASSSTTTTTTAAAEQPAEQPTEQPVAAPPISTTEAAAATSATGTLSSLLTLSTRIAPLPKLAPAGPAAVAPGPPPDPPAPSAIPAQVTKVSSAPPTDSVPTSSEVVALAAPTSSEVAPTAVPANSEIAPAAFSTSSDTSPTAVPTSPLAASSIPGRFTAPAASNALNSLDTSPDQPIQTDTNAQPSVIDTTAVEQPQPTSSVLDAIPSGGSAGIIAPDQGSDGSSDDSPLTLGNGSSGNIGGIIGGVFGGVAALALISGLLFFCLRKRKSRPVRWNEKKAAGPGFVEKMKSIPAGVGVFVAKLKGSRAGPADSAYQRHTAQSSVGSVYSKDTSGRIRSASEPQGMFGVKRAGSNRSMSSKKSERNLLRKKPSSVSSNYRFPSIMEGTASSNRANANPFADPEPPKSLMLLNPDPWSAPVTPQVPAATVGQATQDPFASIFDAPGDVSPLEESPILRGHQHRRTISSMSALSSHPPFSYPTNDPFKDRSKAPPAPSQAVLLNHGRRRSSMALPTFGATSSGASRDSNHTFFGEPGPSRPGTNLLTPGLPTGRTVRQSDPFDLDRPEVLGFGHVIGRKELGGSVTRQASRNKRTSSIGNWGSAAGGPSRPYVAGPAWGPNGRR